MKLTPEGQDRLPDLIRFGKRMVSSCDLDPLYPVLVHLQRKMDTEQALWHSVLYVAWYNLPSATAAMELMPEPNVTVGAIESSWPTGIERRNNRGGKVTQHLQSFVRKIIEHDGIEAFLTCGELTAAGTRWQSDATRTTALHANWRVVNEQLQVVHGNGRWAAYKHCEILRRVHGWPIMAPDMGHQFSSGPREGLSMLYGEIAGEGPDIIAELDERSVELQILCAERGLDVDLEELETILCNWKSLMKGKYYVGHDIDELQEQIDHALTQRTITPKQHQRLMLARKRSLPNEYLGELNGWSGVDRARMKVYRDQRKIYVRKPR